MKKSKIEKYYVDCCIKKKNEGTRSLTSKFISVVTNIGKLVMTSKIVNRRKTHFILSSRSNMTA